MDKRVALIGSVVLAAGAAAFVMVSGTSRPPPPATEAPKPAGPDAAFVAGKLSPEVEGGTPVSGGTLTVRANAEPSTMDPLVGADGFLQKSITRNVLEALVEQDPRGHPDYPVVPALAESWTVSDDHLTYTFKLREGV